MSQFSARQRIRYRFDTVLARGLWAVLLWLGVIAVVFFLIIAVIIRLTGIGPGDESTSFGDGLWYALTRSLDPGTFSGDDGSRFRLIMLVVTLAGIFIAATIIGLVSSAIDSRVDSLRRGKSLVVEAGHTLIVGYSDKLSTIVSELVEANLSQRGRAIVVLTSEDTVEVTEEIRAAVPDLRTSRLVVRSGTATRLHDLAQANPQDATAVIVLRPQEGSDAQVVKTVLALSRLVPELAGLTVVAELEDEETAEALGEAVGPSLITVTPVDVIARMTAQVSRAPGLGQIYQELLDFDGDEMYAIAVPERWIGRTFGEVLLGSTAVTVIGLRDADGSVQLCPSPERVLVDGDHVIGIAEDDSVFVLDREPISWTLPDQREWAPLESSVERTLIIGWSSLAPLVAEEIDRHVAPGSQVHVMLDPGLHDASQVAGRISLHHQELVLHEGDPIDRAAVQRVMGHGPYDHVMLLCERERFDADEADARTLLTLMHVRGITGQGGHEENVVAELLDPNDVELGGPRENHDFIVSQRLISLLMTQLSEGPELAPVFRDLFDSEGAVLAVHPLERYLPPGEATFAEVVAAARDWGVVAIGVRARSLQGAVGELGAGIRINPRKDDRLILGDGDGVVVITRS